MKCELEISKCHLCCRDVLLCWASAMEAQELLKNVTSSQGGKHLGSEKCVNSTKVMLGQLAVPWLQNHMGCTHNNPAVGLWSGLSIDLRCRVLQQQNIKIAKVRFLTSYTSCELLIR